jgi:hypothetical protein
MSGGSFNYLFERFENDPAPYSEELRKMGTFLRESGLTVAAARLELVAEKLESAWHDGRALSLLMHEVEWCVSGDTCLDDLENFCAQVGLK